MIAALLYHEWTDLRREWQSVAIIWVQPALFVALFSYLANQQLVPGLALVLAITGMQPSLLVRLWQDDLRTGMVEQVHLSGTSLPLLALIRSMVVAEGMLFPGMLAAMGVLVLNGASFGWRELLAVLLACYALASLTSVVAALMAGGDGERGGGALALLLLFPLILPLLVVLAVALTRPEAALAARYLLAAAALLALPLGAWATATALRQQLSQ